MRLTVPEWVVIRMKSGNNLFLSSELAVDHLSTAHGIARENIADMRVVFEEMMMDGKKGLMKFTIVLDNIRDLDNDMLIHCHLGLNRTPVAAVILLVEKMNYHPSEAISVVEKALKLRKPDYVLNELGLYDMVLSEVEKRYMTRNAPALYQPSKQRVREVEEINQQKKKWYGSQ